MHIICIVMHECWATQSSTVWTQYWSHELLTSTFFSQLPTLFSFSCLFTLYIIFTLLRYQGIGTKQWERKKRQRWKSSREVYGGQRSIVFELTTGVCIEILISAHASRHMATIVRTSSVFFTTGGHKFPTGFLPWRSSLTHDRQCNLECIPCRTKHWLGEDDMASLSSCLHTLRYPTTQINESYWGRRFKPTTRK